MRSETKRLRHAVIGIIVRDEKFLAIERSQTITAPGKICFPGGGVHAGEAEDETLVREFREELEISVRPIKKLHASISSWGYALSWWQASFPEIEKPTPNPEEVARYFWATSNELLKMDLLDSNVEFLNLLNRDVFRLL